MDTIEYQLNKLIGILLYLIDKGYSETLDIIEQQNDKKILISYIVSRYPEIKKLIIFQDIDINALNKIYHEQYIFVNDIKKNGIENNGLLYLIKFASDKIHSICCQYNNNI